MSMTSDAVKCAACGLGFAGVRLVIGTSQYHPHCYQPVDELRRLRVEIERLRAALDKAAYALFQVKRMLPEAIPKFAAEAHEAACKVLNDEQAKDSNP